MNRRLRPLIAALAVAALSVGVVGAAAKSAETVNLTLLWPVESSPAMVVLIANFERVNPNIHITPQYTVNAQMEPLLATQLQAGNAPDLFKVQPGHRSIGVWDLADAGRLLDLTGRKWQKRIFADAKPYVSRNGRVYAWPLSINPYGILYNVDLFKQLKLKVPTSFAAVLAMCKQITAAGKIPFVQGFGDPSNGSIIGRALQVENVETADPNWSEKRVKGSVAFSSSPLWHRALQQFVDLKEANCFNPGSQGMSLAQQFATFANGGAVATIAPASYLPNITAINPNLKYAMVNLPADNPKKTVAISAFTNVIGANAKTAHPNEAKLFIDFLAREQQSTLYAKVSGEIAPLDAKKGIVPAYMKDGLGPYFKSGKTIGGSYIGWPNAQQIFNAVYAAGLQGIITGQSTIDGILKKMDDVWNGTG